MTDQSELQLITKSLERLERQTEALAANMIDVRLGVAGFNAKQLAERLTVVEHETADLPGIRKIVYGVVALMLTGVVGGILLLVLRR